MIELILSEKHSRLWHMACHYLLSSELGLFREEQGRGILAVVLVVLCTRYKSVIKGHSQTFQAGLLPNGRGQGFPSARQSGLNSGPPAVPPRLPVS